MHVLAFAVEGLPDGSLLEFDASVAVAITALSLLLVVTPPPEAA